MRKELRERWLLNKFNDKTFYEFKIRKNSILIVEPNCYHGEILPGFVKYFQDLGYNTDLFLRHENVFDSPFSGTEDINIFSGTEKHLRRLLKLKKIKEYEFVFFSSSAYWEHNGYMGSYLNYLGFRPKAKNGILLLEHNADPYLKEYGEEVFLNSGGGGRLFCISGFHNVPMLNPHFFALAETTPKTAEKTIFITVGGIYKDCKNHDLLFESALYLKNLGYNFEIIVIGNGELDIPPELNGIIRLMGRLKFANMFSEMNRADYFLPLLDPNLKEHKRYLTGTTSGSRQLILGFKKPCIINENFAEAYNFTPENSICYSNNDIAHAMEVAIIQSSDDHQKMQNNLSVLSDKIYKESLQNLKHSIEGIKNENI